MDFYNDSGEEVKCKPKFKITENSLVVGFLTSSNQFVKIDPPREIRDVQDDIKVYDDHSHYDTDKILRHHGNMDDKREKLMKMSIIIRIIIKIHFLNKKCN